MKPIDDDFTELVDADIPRVDIVGKAANGRRWALIKSEAEHGLLSTADVDSLLKEADPVEVWKAKYDTADRKHLADTGAAMSDGSYPIEDKEDLENAIHAVGRGGADHDAIRRHIITRAKSLGATTDIPDDWNNDGSLKEGNVTKETDAPDDVVKDDADLDVTEPLAEPDNALDQLEAVTPGSPAWEQVDAATAIKWAGILARAKNALELLADREGTEAVTVDPDDAENQWNLEDAACAIDYAIGVLGAFAAGEQAEADIASEMEQVGKSATELDEQLPTVEALGAVIKAGRTLSAANEAALRTAAESIQKVLASLPPAPDDIEKKEATVAEEKPVTKAAGDDDASLTAVFNQSGKLIGVVPADQIQAVSGAGADAAADDSDSSSDADAAPADSTAADGEQTAEQTAASTDSEAPIPGTDTIQSPTAADDTDVKKGSLTSGLLEALEEVLAPIAKKLDAHAELATTVQSLQERVEKLAKSPDDRRSPVLNGATGAGIVARGEEETAFSDLQKAINEETDPGRRRDLQSKLVYEQIRSRFA